MNSMKMNECLALYLLPVVKQQPANPLSNILLFTFAQLQYVSCTLVPIFILLYYF